MGFKDTLGSIWPNYGAVTGRGSYGQMLNPDQAAENATEDYKAKMARQYAGDQKRQADMMSEFKPAGMKKGGKVKSASQRADGCCIRGKTRA